MIVNKNITQNNAFTKRLRRIKIIWDKPETEDNTFGKAIFWILENGLLRKHIPECQLNQSSYQSPIIKERNNHCLKSILTHNISMHMVDWRFEDLEYLIVSIHVLTLLSVIKEYTFSKLHPSELMDVRFERSTFYHSNSLQKYFALPVSCTWQLIPEVSNNRV